MADARLALVAADGAVWTVTELDAEAAPGWTPPSGLAAVPCGPEVGAGWTWTGAGGFAPPAPEPAPVPAAVTNAQARAALMGMPGVAAGPTLFDDIDAALRAEKDGAAADRIAWQFWEQANEFTRTGMLVNTMAARFGLTQAQLDELFIAAAAIEV